MEKYYCFGHMHPDTDSVCASMALANLKRKLGLNVEERVLGNVNKETKYVLNYFNLKEPKYLNDVKLKIKDINYRENAFLNEFHSIEDVYNYMQVYNTTGVPIVTKENEYIGLITAKDILRKSFHVIDERINTSYENIINTLNAKAIVKIDEEIKGNITTVSFAEKTFENTQFSDEDILLIGDRLHIINQAILSRVKLIIIAGEINISEELINLALENKVNIILTKMSTFEATRIILYSNYIKTIVNDDTNYIVQESDYYDEFISKTENLRIDNFPVIDKNGKCLGLLRKSEISRSTGKNVILVDHNEPSQSVIGLEEANIVEIVDHHKISTISTNAPINFRNMIVGSTSTIVYLMYKENNIEISKPMAGLMLSGLISDTMLFKSPTTTDIDLKVAHELNKICLLNIDEYGLNMFRAGTSLEGLSIKEIILMDFKTFIANEENFIVSQVFTLNHEEILNNKSEYLKEIENAKIKNKVNHFVFVVTDIMRNGSYFLFDLGSEDLIKKAFSNRKMFNGVFLDGFVSRKKQIVPLIMEALEK